MLDDAVILLVDDDPDVLALTSLQLEAKGWRVETADNGASALQLVTKAPDKFSVIVSDIMMPEMDGYALCRRLKFDPDLPNIPILFLSSLTDLEEKIKGYGAGVDDYISKPVNVDELSMKLSALLVFAEKEKNLTNQLAETTTVAFQAMNYSSDMGEVLEFYNGSVTAKSFEEIAALLFKFSAGRGLHCTLRVISPQGIVSLSDTGSVSPVEDNVIELSRSKGRFFDFGSRTIINYDDFSVLVKNMPLDDPERYGPLKDTLGTLCNAIEARIKFVIHEDSVRQKQEIVSTVMGVLQSIGQTFSDIQAANVAVIDQLMTDLDQEMMELGLSEQQEELLRQLVDKCHDGSDAVFDRGAELTSQFDEVRRKLDVILDDKSSV